MGRLLRVRAGDVFIYLVMIFAAVITTYPFIYSLSMSISDPQAVIQQKVLLLPVGFNVRSYVMVFKTPSLWHSYYNTLWYTVVGTLLNLVLTVGAAYPLSRSNFIGKKFFTLFITITMFVSGGIIPLFILVSKLGIYNTRWAIVLPAAVNAFNIFLMRVYFQTSIPKELTETATIDGCNDILILLKIILPLSKPIVSVIALFVAVGFWNNYFSALLFLPSANLQPITVLLQRVLIMNSVTSLISVTVNPEAQMTAMSYAAQIKYTVVIVTILPIVCIYPFFQKYFVKGIMLGSVKG